MRQMEKCNADSTREEGESQSGNNTGNGDMAAGGAYYVRIQAMAKKHELNQTIKSEGEKAAFDTGVMNLQRLLCGHPS